MTLAASIADTGAGDELRQRLRRAILDSAIIYALDGQRIVSPNGNEHTWLCDLRRITLDAEGVGMVAEMFWRHYEHMWPFQVGGMETAAVPIVSAIQMAGLARGKPVNGFVVRKERKAWGLARPIEGTLTDAPIIAVDDLTNSGSSLEKIRAMLIELGFVLKDAFTLVDFEAPEGIAWRRKWGIRLHTLFGRRELDLPPPAAPPPPARHEYVRRWSFESPGANLYLVVPKSAPVTDGERIYIGSEKGIVWALDPETGAPAWSFAITGTGPKGTLSTPALHGGRLYTGAYDGVVYCLDAATGRKIWGADVCDWVGSSPVLSLRHRLLVIGLEYALKGEQGAVAALDLDTGEKRWEHRLPLHVHATPLMAPDERWVACGANDNSFSCWETATGQLLWRIETGGEIKAAPGYDPARNHILVGSFDKSVYVIDAETGDVVWNVRTEGAVYTTPLVVGDRAYFGSNDKFLYVLDLAERVVAKKIAMGGKVFAKPAVVDGLVMVGSTRGQVVGIDPDSLRVVDRVTLPDRVVNTVLHLPERGLMLAPTYDNRLIAFGIQPAQQQPEDGQQEVPREDEDPAFPAGDDAEEIPDIRRELILNAGGRGAYFRVEDPAPGDGEGKPFGDFVSRRLLGCVALLMANSRGHQQTSLADLQRRLLPAMENNQLRLFLFGMRPVGLVTWAYVSEEVARQVLAGTRKLEPGDWTSGDRLFLVDLVAPFGGGEDMLKKVRREVLAGRPMSILRPGADGKPELVELDALDEPLVVERRSP